MIKITITIETDSKTKAGHMVKVEFIIGTITTLEVGVTIEIIGIQINIVEVIRRTLMIEMGLMREAEAWIEMKVKDLGE